MQLPMFPPEMPSDDPLTDAERETLRRHGWLPYGTRVSPAGLHFVSLRHVDETMPEQRTPSGWRMLLEELRRYGG